MLRRLWGKDLNGWIGTITSKYLSCTVENALEPGDSHAVVADRNPGIDGRLQTVAQMGGCDHTASALNDQGIIRYRTFDPV